MKIFDQSNEFIRADNHVEVLNELITLRDTAADKFEKIKTLDGEISLLIEDVDDNLMMTQLLILC